MANQPVIDALIRLLDDTDPEVFRHVFDKLTAFGKEIVPELENAWENTFDPELQERIEEVIQVIQFNELCIEFKQWIQEGGYDLLEGHILITRYFHPDIDIENLKEKIHLIRRDAWIELNEGFEPSQEIHVLNQVIYRLHNFKGFTSETEDASSYLLNTLLDTHKGNPLGLGMIYLIVAQMLMLPVYGVPLPKHFVLAYARDYITDFNSPVRELKKEILFYINPVNVGNTFFASDMEEYLEKSGIDKTRYGAPASNPKIISYLLDQLIQTYTRQGRELRVQQLNTLLNMIKDLQ